MADSVFTIINGIKNIVFYSFQLKAVSDASRNAKATLERVERDLTILRRQAKAQWKKLSADQQHDISQLICDTNEAIYRVAKPIRYTERNVEDYGTVTLYRRVVWTVRDGDEVKSGLEQLNTFHQSFVMQFTQLQVASNIPLDPEPVEFGKTKSSEDTEQDQKVWLEFADDEMAIARSTMRTASSSRLNRKRGRSHSSTNDDKGQQLGTLRLDKQQKLTGTLVSRPGSYSNDLSGLETAVQSSSPQGKPRSTSAKIGSLPGDVTALEDFNAFRKEDQRRRDRLAGDSNGGDDTIDDGFLQEFRARRQEDAHRRSRSRTPSAATNG